MVKYSTKRSSGDPAVLSAVMLRLIETVKNAELAEPRDASMN